MGSVQTLQRSARLERFPRDYFGTIIIDEAHHAITDGYRRILDYFSGAKVLGVTATPDRGDMRNLGEVFDSLAFEYKLTDAIKEGYLCKIMAQTIPLQLDITSVTMSGGDYAVGDLGTALDPYLEQIAAEMEVSPQTVNYHIGQALKVLGVALKDYLPLIALFFEMPGNN